MRQPACLVLLFACTISAGDSLSFYAPPYQADEGGTLRVMVVRTGSGAGNIGTNVTVTGGASGAALGVDFTAATPATLAWADGDRSYRVVSVPILHNPAYTPVHSLTLTLSGPTGGAVVDPSLGHLNIPIAELDPNPAGTLNTVLADPTTAIVTVQDDAGQVAIPVVRLGGSSGAVVATASFVDLDAAAGTDFTIPADPTLSWADGESGVKTLLIPILPRSAAAGPKRFAVNISPTSGGAGLGLSGGANITITDHLPLLAGTVGCSSLVTVGEDAGTADVVVTRSAPAAGAVNLDYVVHDSSAFAGTNFQATSGTLHWADGDASPQTIHVPLIPDGASAPTLYAYVDFANPTGGLVLPYQLSASIAITDTDGTAGVIGVATDQVVAREDAGSVEVRVSRLGGTTGTVTVDWTSTDGSAIDGVHYTGGQGTLTWVGGDVADKVLDFPIVADGVLGPVHAFHVTLSAPTGGAALDPWIETCDVILTDVDSDAGTIAWVSTTAQVHESAGAVTLTARRTGGSFGPVSVPITLLDISARAGWDYGAASARTLDWDDGASGDRSLTIPILADGQPGTDRTFRAILGPASGGAVTALPTPAVVTILGNNAQPAAAADGCGGGSATGLLIGLGLLGFRRRRPFPGT